MCRTMNEMTMFEPDYSGGRRRNPDWITSVIGAERVAYRSGSQKDKLLKAYKDVYPGGLTDDEAAAAAGLPMTTCYWKRCGELRDAGLLTVGQPRKSRQNGELRIECFYQEETC